MTIMTHPTSSALFQHVAPIFSGAAFANHLGISLDAVGAGWCETSLTVTPAHLQQHGHVHAGVVTTLADHTCGGAARAAVPPGSDVITIEFKMNFLRPVRGRHLTCRGETLRAGRTIVVSESEVFAGEGEDRQLVAKCTSTLAVIPQAGDREGLTGRPGDQEIGS
jgi:uncharacterized protein (TIGR00369 family)